MTRDKGWLASIGLGRIALELRSNRRFETCRRLTTISAVMSSSKDPSFEEILRREPLSVAGAKYYFDLL
jgi:hypothetical protein